MNDGSCRGSLAFICDERDYHIFESKKSWTDASAYCRSYGSTLATITTNDDAQRIATLMATSSETRFWGGLNDRSSDGNWVYDSGASCGDCGQWWSGNEPNGGTGENCGEIWATSTTAIRMNDLNCADSRWFICDGTTTFPPPTNKPTKSPSPAPTNNPTPAPTANPTPAPTANPTP